MTHSGGFDSKQLPTADYKPWPGVVLCTTKDQDYLSLAGTLASATGRPLIALKELKEFDGPVAYVGPASEITADALSQFGDREVGVLSGYNLLDASALVARTIEHANGHSARRGVLTIGNSAQGGSDEFRRLTRAKLMAQRAELIVLTGHGRECGFTLFDGVMCAKAGAEDRSGPRANERLACATDADECYTRMFGPSKRVGIAELDADIVFVNSCQSYAIGTNRFSGASSLALSFIAGNGLAFVGSAWPHKDESPARVFADAFRAGLRLGECVSLANRVIRPRQTDPRYRLLGDPALRSSDRKQASETISTESISSALLAECSNATPSPWIARGQTLFEAVHAAVSAAPSADLRHNLDEVVVKGLIDRTVNDGYDWTEKWWRDAVTLRTQRRMCPDCRTQCAEELFTTQSLQSAGHLSILLCPRCSTISEFMPGAPDLLIVRRPDLGGEPALMSIEIRGRANEKVWLGGGVVSGPFHGLEVATPPVGLTLDESGRTTCEIRLVLDKDGSSDNVLRVKVFAAIENRISCRTLCVFRP